MPRQSSRGSLVRLQIDKEKVTKAFVAAVERIFKGTGDAMDQFSEGVRAAMSKPGEPVTKPVTWDTELQKRAFFWSKGFGKGIPYVRTQAYENGWTVDRVDTKGNMRAIVRNTESGAFFVGGNYRGYQSKIHRGRWPRLRDVVQQQIALFRKNYHERIQASGRSK